MSDKDNKLLRKNNNIVKAKYSLSVNEGRVFLLLLYKLQVTNETTLTCMIKKEDFNNIFNSERDCTIKNIKNILSELRKKPIYFKMNDKWGEFGFINGYIFDETTNEFTIEASKKIYDLAKEYLQDGYTPNNLAILLNLRSSNTIRFYDLLRMWSGSKKVINYSIDELREYLMLQDKYPLYGDFKRRVLNPAIKELNNTGVLDVKMEEVKVGSKVESVNFIVKDFENRIVDKPKVIKETRKDYKKKTLNTRNFKEREYDLEDLERQLTNY